MRNLGGRPKGSTIIQQREDKERYVSMMNDVAKEYTKVRLTTKKVSNGQFETMLENSKNKHNVKEKVDVRLAQKCVQRRFLRKSIECHHRGTESPMSRLEPAILEIALQRGKMNQPLTVEEGLYLSNSLIKPNSQIEADVISYLKKRGQYCTTGSSTKTPDLLLGTGYWVLGRILSTLQPSTGI